MKHVRIISSARLAPAALWQEIVCTVAQGINTFLGFLGGSLPVTTYVEDKCDIPVPNEGASTTEEV